MKFALGQNKQTEYCPLLFVNLVIIYKINWGRTRKSSRKSSRRKSSFLTRPTLTPKSTACRSTSVRWTRVWCQVLCCYPRRSQGSTKQHWRPTSRTKASGHTQGSHNLFSVRGSPLHTCVKGHERVGRISAVELLDEYPLSIRSVFPDL